MTNTKEARFEVATVCNHKCMICPLNNGDFKRVKTTMSTSLFKNLLDKLQQEAPHITDITISGMGEPTLDKEYIKKIEIAKSKNYNIYMLSNGSNFLKDDIDYLVKNNLLESIRISLHSLNKEHYEKITKTSNLNKVIDNIETFISKKSEYKSSMKIIISADIIEEYTEDASELISTYEDRVDLLEIWRPHNWVDWGEYRKGIKKKTTCGRPFNGPLQIQVDGTINMCCFDYNGELLLGDFTKQTLKEIFNSEMYNRLLNFHNGDHNDNLICSKCDQLYEKDSSIMIYNSKFDIDERINKTSTKYEELK
ncbi:MAG: radical SAM/SPASM domain-containing protein [Candidatus Woesearchaeota archaeon]